MPLVLVALFLLSLGRLNAADTLHIRTHDRETVVTDPVTGFKAYRQWGVFPAADIPVRKINLKVSFGCPDSMRCADWDYLDHIFIRRRGGVGAASQDAEVARMLTPYGGAFGPDWSFEWTVDVTDFSLLLRDSVEIEYYHSGYEPNEDRGWAISLDFEVVLGPPAAKPLSILQLWNGSFPYGDSTQHIEQFLQPVSFESGKDAAFARLRIHQTGHGMDAAGCGEFCSRYREVLHNERMVDRRPIWKSCGDNPLYPQAGTWIFDRANWCPGYLQQPDLIDLPLSSRRKHTVDINMEPYQQAKPSANESFAVWLIQYARPSAEKDAAVEAVLAPSTRALYSRWNPVCGGPVVVIRNNGHASLESATVIYGMEGDTPARVSWEGRLAFGEVDTLYLPGSLGEQGAGRRFRVAIELPGDAWPDDNVLYSATGASPVHGEQLIVHFRTNKEPGQNDWEIRPVANDRPIYSRSGADLEPDRDYRDTLLLEPGCYELILRDSAGDGLEFWFNNKGGRGFFRLLDGEGRLLKGFESDCGDGHRYQFAVSADARLLSPPTEAPQIGLFPTRTTGSTTLDYFSNEPSDVEVQIVTDAGELVETHHYRQLREGVFTYDLGYRAPQRYYLRVFRQGLQQFNKRIRVVER